MNEAQYLIKLSGLTAKAQIVDLTGNDCAVIYNTLLRTADKLQSDPDEYVRIALDRKKGNWRSERTKWQPHRAGSGMIYGKWYGDQKIIASPAVARIHRADRISRSASCWKRSAATIAVL